MLPKKTLPPGRMRRKEHSANSGGWLGLGSCSNMCSPPASPPLPSPRQALAVRLECPTPEIAEKEEWLKMRPLAAGRRELGC